MKKYATDIILGLLAVAFFGLSVYFQYWLLALVTVIILTAFVWPNPNDKNDYFSEKKNKI